MRNILILVLCMASFWSTAQQPLSLEACYAAAIQNYPIAKQRDLWQQKNHLETAALYRAKLPKIDLQAQATYQSDVTQLPIAIPNMAITPANQDQYRLTAQANQLVYHGGLIGVNVKLNALQMATEQQEISIQLYQLQSRIAPLFFSILVLQEKNLLLLAKQKQLALKSAEMQSGVQSGAVLIASKKTLEAESLRIKQQLTEIKYQRKNQIENLATLTVLNIDQNVVLVRPTIQTIVAKTNQRPELQLLDLKSQQIDLQKNIIGKNNLPKINAFGQIGYGNPGLNMLDNSFQTFYVLGIRASWKVLDWNQSQKEQQALTLSKGLIATEKERFVIQNQVQLQETENQSYALQEMVTTDKEIIRLREYVEKSAAAQLKYGVITASEYVVALTELYEAKTNEKCHLLQLALAQENYQLLQGQDILNTQ
ncbi:TolC family protein [Flavobacterium crassostreae]|uniref:Transporter n=1 Tax=Flavobacterium crassostreae TaxID=1763534 RepID=A0A1B9E995_9FLAO|nr:TolC family protein [Flavobacterium crassostreae]OCB78540.1 transporter [Flavobacterium crassostreae]